jgi:hypothetical protein
LLNFVGVAAVFLAVDVGISVYRHDWQTSTYWLIEAGKAILLGLWMAAITAFGEYRKRRNNRSRLKNSA